MTTSRPKLFAVSVLMLGLLLLVGCSGTRRPLLYPNDHFHQVGEAQARADVNQCMRLAENQGAPVHGAEDTARDVAVGAALGGATAGAWGLVRNSEDAGNRALGGAAAGGAAGLVRGALRTGQPSQAYKGFVNLCLRERGYTVAGWR